MTLDEVVRRFGAQKSGDGYRAPCPIHNDDKPSLTITPSKHRILLHCHAGCQFDAILRAKNLTSKDLFVNGNGNNSNGHQSSPIVATYEYRDLDGTLRYRKHRAADKHFWFDRPNGNGGWLRNRQGVERLPYRLPEVREHADGYADRVWIVEGEKDADRLWSIGLPATTNDAGASQDGQRPKWTAALTQQLRDAGVTEVVCIPDNDDSGRAHMQAVAASCHEASMTVRIVPLDGLADKEDVSDWLDRGHTREELIARASATPIYSPTINLQEETAPVTRPPATPRTLSEVHGVFTRYLGDDYDLDALDVMLVAVAAERLDGDPLWVLLISGPGNAKTETVQAASGAGAVCVSTIASEGALLSASPKREQAKGATGGLLRQIGSRGVLVVKDLTSILSMQTNTRAPILSALREIHDGRWVRTVGTDGGKTLTWAGRLAIIGACTTAWDTHHSAIATMGDRFVLLRMDSRIGRESAGQHAIKNTGREIEMRQDLADAVEGLLGTVDASQSAALTDAQIRTLLDAANITAICRTGVEYDYRGDPIEAHMPEMPTRFAKQLTQIVRGGVAMGMSADDALRLAIRCARDSMPPLRLAILRDLWLYPGSSVEEIRARLDLPYVTVRRQVHSLHLLQALTCVESVETVEAHIEEGDEGKRRRTLKKRVARRYSVVPDLRADALGLHVPETLPDDESLPDLLVSRESERSRGQTDGESSLCPF